MLSERGGQRIHLAPFPPQESSLPTIPGLEALTGTKVLLAISVAGNADLSVANWTDWLKSDKVPAGIMRIVARIESAYESNSTMVLLTVPISAWSRMVDRDAYNFIGFVRSENLLETLGTQGQNTTKGEQSESPASSQDSRVRHFPYGVFSNSAKSNIRRMTVESIRNKINAEESFRRFRDRGFEDLGSYSTDHGDSRRAASSSQSLSFAEFLRISDIQNTADHVQEALRNKEFPGELEVIVRWFKILSDPERLAALGNLLGVLTAEQRKFMSEFLYKSGHR